MEADVFQNDDGRVVVTMRHPPTFHRSVDCFLKAIQSDMVLTVVVSPVQIIQLLGGGCYDRWIGLAAKPVRVCDVDPTMVPCAIRSDAGSKRPAKTSKTATGSDDAAAAATAATGSSSADHDLHSSGDGSLDPDISEELFKEAADIHDDGLSVAHATEDVDNATLTAEVRELTEDMGPSKAINSARAKGSLPEQVEVSVFGDATCYTTDELEFEAVQTMLMRCVTSGNWFGDCVVLRRVATLMLIGALPILSATDSGGTLIGNSVVGISVYGLDY